MKLIQKFQIVFLIQLIFTEILFILFARYNYAITVLLLTVIYLLVVEAYSRGISNFNLKTKPAELAIEMAKDQKSEIATELAQSISKSKQKSVIAHNTEIIEERLDEVFELGLAIGKFYSPKDSEKITNVQLLKDSTGKAAGIKWEEI